jgi:hypothetical protein
MKRKAEEGSVAEKKIRKRLKPEEAIDTGAELKKAFHNVSSDRSSGIIVDYKRNATPDDLNTLITCTTKYQPKAAWIYDTFIIVHFEKMPMCTLLKKTTLKNTATASIGVRMIQRLFFNTVPSFTQANNRPPRPLETNDLIYMWEHGAWKGREKCHHGERKSKCVLCNNPSKAWYQQTLCSMKDRSKVRGHKFILTKACLKLIDAFNGLSNNKVCNHSCLVIYEITM